MEKETVKSNEVKTNKPFYKKWWFIAIIVAVVLIVIALFIGLPKKEKKLDLSTTNLGYYLPELPAKKGKINYDSNSSLDLTLYDVTKAEYNDYIKKCEEKGFNIDVTSDSSFEAFNENGDRIYMYFSDKTNLKISFSVARKLEKITWPTSELANTLPIPEFDGGYISTDTSNEISITLGHVSKENYDKYVNECSAKGYNKNYKKSNKHYTADNDQGNHLELSYYGGQRMNISLESTSSDSSSSTPTTTEPPKTNEQENQTTSSSSSTTSTSSNGLSKEFKDAMDSYESFMNEYIDFMKKYQANSTDLSLLNQYATIMQKYSEQVEAFDEWESEDMSTEEAKYYIDVQTRVNKKLLDIAQ